MEILKRTALAIALSVSLGVTIANAAGNGSSPKGKPFVAINDQIVEVEGAISSLQDQIDLLVARVDTVEQRATANENAISTLQNQNAALSALVQQNLSDIASINAEITALQQANSDLQAQITANSGDIASLEAEVAANDALIATLQSAILMVQNDIISLESSLQSQIDNNTSLIDALQDEVDIINAKLELKQNLVNGTCPNGYAIQQILSNGSVICEGVSGASGQLESVWSYMQTSYASPGVQTGATAYCPSGYTVTGAGFYGALGWDLGYNYTSSNSTYYGNYAYVGARNENMYSDYMYVIATCTRIAP